MLISILMLYLYSVFFSIIIIMGSQIIARNKASQLMNRFMKIMKVPTEREYGNANKVVLIPIINVIIALFLLWFITAPEEKIDEFIDFFSNNKED